ncbi:hypothetical protein GWI33_020763 [Rhynchophorus ferrugineus]|uniref:Secreted protein n=1 Tax=Rhynchophorus ferrugineus TaxID=354439 RepID=A0A834M5C3_RHYFE|nr:hypothetical protein GWI33_020763 [Rhynchophorus ferrugineus]
MVFTCVFFIRSVVNVGLLVEIWHHSPDIVGNWPSYAMRVGSRRESHARYHLAVPRLTKIQEYAPQMVPKRRGMLVVCVYMCVLVVPGMNHHPSTSIRLKISEKVRTNVLSRRSKPGVVSRN